MKNNKVLGRLLLILVFVLLVVIIGFIALIGHKRTTSHKVGLILTGSINDQGWNEGHYRSALRASEKLGVELMIKENVSENEAECEAAVEELVSEGVNMIVLTSFSYSEKLESLVQKYSDIAFYAISTEQQSNNITVYFGRMYQVRYLTGILAGMKTQSNEIGYVAAMSNAEVNRGINAFTLGVKSVNPKAQVNVIWTESWDNTEKEVEATNTLIEKTGSDVITYHQNQHNVARAADAAGVYSIGYNEAVTGTSEKCLTAAVWNWNALYYVIIRELVQGEANKVKCHWFGMDTEVVGLSAYSESVTEEEQQMVEAAKKRILSGEGVFSGEIYDNEGEIRCSEGESLSDELLRTKMDWYVDGVVIYGQ